MFLITKSIQIVAIATLCINILTWYNLEQLKRNIYLDNFVKISKDQTFF